MIIGDLKEIIGRTYPARRLTQNLVGGASPVQCDNFCMGYVTLEPNGGQVPWHNQESEEIYFVISGTGETAVRADGEFIRIQALPSLAPKEKATWQVVVKAKDEEDARFKVELTSDYFHRPIWETEATYQYSGQR